MKKSERPKASKREDEVDFISNMPDAILLLILSRLQSTEEVIRTSILSTRWRLLADCRRLVHLFYRGLQIWSADCRHFTSKKTNSTLVKEFLRRCPLLEDLTLLDCFLAKLDLLCISCPKLKNLSIINVGNAHVCNDIEICCPILVYLDLTGYIASNYIFKCLDSLKEAVINPEMMGYSISVLPGLYHVESLSVGLVSFYFGSIDTPFDKSLPNLKTLELCESIDNFSLDEFIQILKYYPKLESLKLIFKEDAYSVLKYWELNEAEPRRMLPYDVKRVELFEFNGEKPELAISWDEHALLEMVFSWGKKSQVP